MPFKAEGAQGELPGIAWVTVPAITAAVKQGRHCQNEAKTAQGCTLHIALSQEPVSRGLGMGSARQQHASALQHRPVGRQCVQA